MRRIIRIIICFLLITCKPVNSKDICNDELSEYKESLRFIKKYHTQKGDSSYLVKEITKNINILETKSGIKSEIGGEFLGYSRITSQDVVNWEQWLAERCNDSSKLVN